ncbi:Chorion peroxidase [Portunus trituberculatus]|uniref:Chorion peroxidase n=1 Tax=Portunus trituberculatus TaxID=210409 RepID=A0A5B7JEH8_PORTR|nr:Chorion peroxidase [Portunus trituberculatus]
MKHARLFFNFQDKLVIPDVVRTKAHCLLPQGEIRVNEQLVLAVIHTLMMREHNRLAEVLAHLNPHWDDERLYQLKMGQVRPVDKENSKIKFKNTPLVSYTLNRQSAKRVSTRGLKSLGMSPTILFKAEVTLLGAQGEKRVSQI